MFKSLPSFGMFLAIISSNKFSVPFSFPSPLELPLSVDCASYCYPISMVGFSVGPEFCSIHLEGLISRMYTEIGDMKPESLGMAASVDLAF